MSSLDQSYDLAKGLVLDTVKLTYLVMEGGPVFGHCVRVSGEWAVDWRFWRQCEEGAWWTLAGGAGRYLTTFFTLF